MSQYWGVGRIPDDRSAHKFQLNYQKLRRKMQFKPDFENQAKKSLRKEVPGEELGILWDWRSEEKYCLGRNLICD